MGEDQKTEGSGSQKEASGWVSLDTLSKVAAIITPLLLAVGGWYSDSLWKGRDADIATYKETATTIGKLSATDTVNQRDILFSIIQLGDNELISRVAAYISTRIDLEREAIKFSNKADQDKNKDTARYFEIKRDIFLPLLLSSISARDLPLAKALLNAAPESANYSFTNSQDDIYKNNDMASPLDTLLWRVAQVI